MTTKKISIFFAVTSLVMAVPAFAYTISQSQVFTGITNMSGSLPDFNQFDNHGDIWQLQSIQVSFTLQTSGGYLEIYNNSSSPASITFDFGTNGFIASTDVCLPDMSLQVYDGNHIELSNLGDSRSYDGGIKTNTKLVSIGETFWNAGNKGFEGTGTYTIDYSISQWFDWSGSGWIRFDSLPPNASSIVTVLYTYNETIPEPATIALLGTGILVFLLKRKKKKR